jgi:hypothetical protein
VKIKETFKSNLIFISFLIFVIIFIVLVAFYWIDNPLNTPLKKIEYPYYLTIQPNKISKNEHTQIYFSSSENKLENISIMIINPLSDIILKSSNFTIPMKFPNVINQSIIAGNYTILFVKDNKLLISSSFSVSDFPPWLREISTFFATNIPTIAGTILIPLVPILYQYISAQRSKRLKEIEDEKRRQERQLEEKRLRQERQLEEERFRQERQKEEIIRKLERQSNWIIENSKYYFDLRRTARVVCKFFPKNPSDNKPYFDPSHFDNKHIQKIMFSIIQCIHSHNSFRKNTYMFYFDNVWIEDFLSGTHGEIRNCYEEIIKDDLTNWNEFENISFNKILNEQKFNELCDNLKGWLFTTNDKKKMNSEIFYKYHFAYFHVMFIAINEGLSITYSDDQILVDNVKYEMERECKELLEESISLLNSIIFKNNTDKYFELLFNKKPLF